jgi:hypothetical protein
MRRRYNLAPMVPEALSFHVFHIGDQDPIVREHLNSLRRHYPSSRIVYLTDTISDLPETRAIDIVSRRRADSSSIMYSRVAFYASEPVVGPTFFLDTDMLVNKPISDDIFHVLAGNTAVCKRQYNNNALFNCAFRGIDFTRFQGMSVGDVFPYLACCTYTETSELWQMCLETMKSLDECFFKWYGDQECLKLVQEKLVQESRPFKALPESLFAALPNHSTAEQAYFIHYKGNHKDRLRDMIDAGVQIG